MSVGIRRHSPYDVVSVGKLIIHEIGMEEAIDSLISGKPNPVPGIDEQTFDEIEPR